MTSDPGRVAPAAQHPPGPGARRSQTRRLGAVLALTVAYMGAEIVGGLWSNSLALLADAGHMLTDNVAIAVALLASWTARRPPDASRTYGYRRVEILAALLNGAILVVASVAIVVEAWDRLREPPDVDASLMAAIAVGGLVVNLVAARVLHAGHRHDLNVRAAYLHVVGDLLGSIGALAAAVSMSAFGWHWPDPVASVLIAVIIVISAGRLLLESIDILMESVPAGLDVERVSDALRGLEGVDTVHDLHLWSLAGTSTPVLTAHVVVDHSRTHGAVLRDARDVLAREFGIDHATIQIEPPDFNIVATIDPRTGSD